MWEMAILSFYEIGELLNAPESKFADAVMQNLMNACLLTRVPSSDEGRFLRRYGHFDPAVRRPESARGNAEHE